MARVTGPILFLIPARGGSVRIPGKNLRTVAGIPLVGHAARTALLAAGRIPGGPHRVVCSTDDAAIAAAAGPGGPRSWTVRPSSRRPRRHRWTWPSTLSMSSRPRAAPRAAISAFRALVLVQPTSPLTDPDDVVTAVERFDTSAGRSVASVTTTHPAGWHVSRAATPAREADTISRVDAADAGEILTGAIYVVDPSELRARRQFVGPGTIGMPVPPERSIDVDEPLDLAVAEAIAAARPVRSVELAGHRIGDGPVFVIAEAGVNHDGRTELAHRLVDAAADAGADAVKFQTFDPDALAAAGAPTAEYQRRSAAAGDDQRAMLARLALPADAGRRCGTTPASAASSSCRPRSTTPRPTCSTISTCPRSRSRRASSPTCRSSPGSLAAAGPLLVSTGMAEIVEVAAAIDAIAAAGDPPVALFHCVSNYPARPADANLRAIATMRSAFGVPVGWSDHTLGIELALAAVASGAAMVEKHLTLDRSAAGPDHAASLEPDELARMVAGIRAVEAALGSGEKRPVEAERAMAAGRAEEPPLGALARARAARSARRSRALRPGTGSAPAARTTLVGRRTRRAP